MGFFFWGESQIFVIRFQVNIPVGSCGQILWPRFSPHMGFVCPVDGLWAILFCGLWFKFLGPRLNGFYGKIGGAHFGLHGLLNESTIISGPP